MVAIAVILLLFPPAFSHISSRSCHMVLCHTQDQIRYHIMYMCKVGSGTQTCVYLAVQVALELGSYIGYSAIRIARKLPPGGKLYGIDPSETYVPIAREMIQHAGLSDKVEIIQGILETSILVRPSFTAPVPHTFHGMSCCASVSIFSLSVCAMVYSLPTNYICHVTVLHRSTNEQTHSKFTCARCLLRTHNKHVLRVPLHHSWYPRAHQQPDSVCFLCRTCTKEECILLILPSLTT